MAKPLSLIDRLIISVATHLAYGLIKLWFLTCRVRTDRRELYDQWVNSEKPVIIVTWHRASIFFVQFFGSHRPMIMFSRSKDGEYLARFAQMFGVQPVRGSSSRGGATALREMTQYLKKGGKACASVLDGPRGPAREAKKGMIVLAMETGAPIIPIIWSAKRVFTFKKSWDKTMLPLPFSTIMITAADPIFVPPDLSPQTQENYRVKMETILNQLTDEADRICGYQPPERVAKRR
jgi:lysophospholipid acyltransferase (LPLAT)-like uncharacterized protein